MGGWDGGGGRDEELSAPLGPFSSPARRFSYLEETVLRAQVPAVWGGEWIPKL